MRTLSYEELSAVWGGGEGPWSDPMRTQIYESAREGYDACGWLPIYAQICRQGVDNETQYLAEEQWAICTAEYGEGAFYCGPPPVTADWRVLYGF